jgi:hypothetical protein
VQVVAGMLHTCARFATGRVRCWGSNASGELGDGSFTGRGPTGPDVVGLTDAVELATGGGEYGCAIRADGNVVCWGRNHEGQLGDGGRADSPAPVPVVFP